VKPHHPTCLDHVVPDRAGHHEAILRGLARLSGAHRAGRLSDLVDRFPRLFPDHARDAEFRERFLADVPVVLAATGRIQERLPGSYAHIS
jgi:hypothetical protein